MKIEITAPIANQIIRTEDRDEINLKEFQKWADKCLIDTIVPKTTLLIFLLLLELIHRRHPLLIFGLCQINCVQFSSCTDLSCCYNSYTHTHVLAHTHSSRVGKLIARLRDGWLHLRERAMRCLAGPDGCKTELEWGQKWAICVWERPLESHSRPAHGCCRQQQQLNPTLTHILRVHKSLE